MRRLQPSNFRVYLDQSRDWLTYNLTRVRKLRSCFAFYDRAGKVWCVLQRGGGCGSLFLWLSEVERGDWYDVILCSSRNTWHPLWSLFITWRSRELLDGYSLNLHITPSSVFIGISIKLIRVELLYRLGKSTSLADKLRRLSLSNQNMGIMNTCDHLTLHIWYQIAPLLDLRRLHSSLYVCAVFHQ